MRKARAFSAGSVVRAVALGAALCAAAVAPGCTGESFNLLQVAAAGTGGAATAVAGAASAGAAPSAGGASGSNDLDAGAGRAGSPHGFGGFGGGFHGLGGATATQPSSGGNGQEEPCLAGDQCIDGGLNCPPTVQVCKRCTKDWQCTDSDARFCDTQDGRCAECLHTEDCPTGDICHPLTLRCMHYCNVGADCVFDHDKPQCDMFHACVSCNDASDCHEITGHPNDVCVFGTCADCYDDQECPTQRPYCVGLVCQTKR